MKAREKSKTDDQGSVWLMAMAQMLKGALLSGILIMVMLLFGSMLISSGMLGQDAAQAMIPASCVIGCLVGGLFAVRKHGSRAIITGFGVGAILFLLLISIGTVAFGEISLGQRALTTMLACLCGGTMAGILGRKTKKKHKR